MTHLSHDEHRQFRYYSHPRGNVSELSASFQGTLTIGHIRARIVAGHSVSGRADRGFGTRTAGLAPLSKGEVVV